MSRSDTAGAATTAQRPQPQDGTHERPPERDREGPQEPGPPGPERDREKEDEQHPVEADEPGAGGTPEHGRQADGAAREGIGRQRLVPQDRPPAPVLDDENIAGEKDFELKPPAK